MNQASSLLENFHQAPTRKLEVLVWWAPLAVILIIAAFLRLALLGGDLPANYDPDEAYYYLWAKAIRDTGRPNVEHGTGYPPGFLYLLGIEQIITEQVRGEAYNVSIDPFIVARVVNGLLGVAGVFLAGLLGWRVGKSYLAGLLSALVIAILGLMVTESRRGAANAPWLFFTLLAFWLLFEARDRQSWPLLYASVVSGVFSLLVKYQSGVILGLPYLFALFYFRKSKSLWLHLAVWTVILGALLAWLVFSYGILEIVHTPATETSSVVSDGKLVGLQSLTNNWRVISGAAEGQIFLWGAIGAGVLALLAFKFRSVDSVLDRSAVLAFVFFSVTFYLLMSLFKTTAPSKWMVLIAVVIIMALVCLVALARLAGLALARLNLPPLTVLGAALAPVIVLAYVVFRSGPQLLNWSDTYRNQWAKTNTLNALNLWYAQQVPQGGRLIAEVNKLVYNYVGAPRTVHASTVWSIFDEPIENYRAQGYDYMVWTSASSPHPDKLADLDAKIPALEQQGVHQVLRLTGPDVSGWDIVVFQLPPFQQHPLYAWFTPAISFRGYDLNQDTFRPGDPINLMLYWESADLVQANYIVFVHVLDPNTGNLIAGQDGPPDYGNTPTWKWQADMQLIRDQRQLSLPADVPPGTYSLRIGMYDAATQERVPITDLHNQPLGDGLDLQTITVKP